MPVFKFKCNSCERTEQQLMKSRVPWYLCDHCPDGRMEIQLPTSTSTTTKEMKDPHRGVSHTKGLKQQLTKRMNEHHDRHEVERKIDEFGIDDAKKFGWDKRVKR